MFPKIHSEERQIHLVARHDKGDLLLHQSLAIIRGDPFPHQYHRIIPLGLHLSDMLAELRRRFLLIIPVDHEQAWLLHNPCLEKIIALLKEKWKIPSPFPRSNYQGDGQGIM